MIFHFKGKGHTLKGDNSFETGLHPTPPHPFKKGTALKGKERGENSFLLNKTVFQNGTDVRERKQKVTKLYPLYKRPETLSSVYSPINKYRC